jgi:hypothetical protein
MITIGPTDTLAASFVRVFPFDGAFIAAPDRPESPADDAPLEEHAAYRKALAAWEADTEARFAAFDKFHETGDASLLAPYEIPGKKPTQIHLRHLDALVGNALPRILAPTTLDDSYTNESWAVLAHMSIEKFTDWDGPELTWEVRKGGSEGFAEWTLQVLSTKSLNLLARVPGLFKWIGIEALKARQLRPL